jgi:hypothetical protein
MGAGRNHVNDTGNDARTAGDDWLDGLLRADAREHASTYVGDDGFTARVLRALPAPLALPAWRKPAIAVLWGAAGVAIAVALPAAAVDVAREAYRLLAAQPVSLSGIAGALVAAGALTWSAAAYALRSSD